MNRSAISGLAIAIVPAQSSSATAITLSSSDDSRVTANRVLDEFTASTGIPICHIEATLQRVPQPATAFASDRRSLTRLGHEVYAYALANTILQRTPGPWLPAQSASRAPVVPIAAEAQTLPDSDSRSTDADIRSTTILSRLRTKSLGEPEGVSPRTGQNRSF